MFLAVLQRVRSFLQFGRQFSVIEKLYVAVQIRLYIFYCSIFSPQMQGFSCIWVFFLSKAKKSSAQELSYGIESFKPLASKKQMIFGGGLTPRSRGISCSRWVTSIPGHAATTVCFFVLTNCKQSRFPLPKTEKI